MESEKHNFRITPIASDLEHPWGIAFLPDNRILVTEREGRLRLIDGGELLTTPIAGLPRNMYIARQGGLLDVAVDPDFEKNQYIYLSYAGRDENDLAGTEVIRARLNGLQLEDMKVIFAVAPKTKGAAHYGSRLAFDKTGKLIITVGDRYNYMKEAQNPANHLGSIMRINTDGTVPSDNPFVGKDGYRPEILSYGHRNVQGLAIRPSNKSIWAHEHGPRGGDEVNIINAGANYGWPAITYGIDYDGDIISNKTHEKGMKQPVIYWTPSIAPSGMDFYTGNKFPKWRGNIFVGALAGAHLRRLELDGYKVIDQEILLEDFARIRAVKTGPDGYLYILTDAYNGGVFRLSPAP